MKRLTPTLCTLSLALLAGVASAQQGNKEPYQYLNELWRHDDAARAAERAALQLQLEQLEAATTAKRAEIRQRAHALEQLPKKVSYNIAATSFFKNDGRWKIGIHVSPRGSKQNLVVGKVIPKTPADQAGVEEGDVIESVNGIRVHHVSALNAIINAAEKQELTFKILRDGEGIEKHMTPMESPPRGSTWTRKEQWSPSAAVEWKELHGSEFSDEDEMTIRLLRETVGKGSDSEIVSVREEIRELRQLVERLASGLAENEEDEEEIELEREEDEDEEIDLVEGN